MSQSKKLKLGELIHLTITEATFMALAQERYAALQALNKINNFYDYKKESEGIWREFGREVLEANISEVYADRRKKTPYQIWENKYNQIPSL